MPRFCASCGGQVEDSATFCPACGKAVGHPGVTAPAAVPLVAPVAAGGGLDDNVAAALAYLFIPAIFFLAVEPYNKRPFVRFHAFQSIFVAIAETAVWIALSILMHIPFLNLIVLFVVWPAFGLGCLILWLLLLLKAYQGAMFKLPFIGDLAEKQASAR